MATIPETVVNKLSALQNQIWQTVSLTVSEAANAAVSFGTPLVTVTPTAELYGEMSAPRLIVQFAFASSAENSQVLLISQDTFGELASLFKNEDLEEVDEQTVSEVRPQFEAIVQGICLAVGNIRNEPMVASGLSVRYQMFSFPPNLQAHDELIRANITVIGDGVKGTVSWLLDGETAAAITGMQVVAEPEAEEDEITTPAFAQRAEAGTAGTRGVIPDDKGLDILMDIPLEISVELGRVKMMVKEVVDLGSGSIVEIEKAAGEPVDVLVNGRYVARGEVVVIEDNFGVRITEILTPQERLNKLNEAS